MTAPSRLLIIGAGGRTGRFLTQLAVVNGHVVTTLTRRPLPPDAASSVDQQVIGDATDPAVLAEALRDQDAVITVVAAPDRNPTMMVSDITRRLLTEMNKTELRRLVVTSSRNITATTPWIAVAPTKWIFRHVYADLERAENLVQSSDLDWTIVRAVMLTDDPPRGGVHIDQDINATGGDWNLPRADYARVLLDTAVDTATAHQALGVNGRK